MQSLLIIIAVEWKALGVSSILLGGSRARRSGKRKEYGVWGTKPPPPRSWSNLLVFL